MTQKTSGRFLALAAAGLAAAAPALAQAHDYPARQAYADACQKKVDDFPGHNHFEFYPSDARAIFEQVVRTKAPIAPTRPVSASIPLPWPPRAWASPPSSSRTAYRIRFPTSLRTT